MITTVKEAKVDTKFNLLDLLQFWKVKRKINLYKPKKVRKIKYKGFLRPAVLDRIKALGHDVYFYDFGENSWYEIILNKYT